MDLTEEIKSRLSIEQLVAQYVQLKPAGRNLKGLCPFHKEKSPSFMVSPEKQICWCFGCQKGGDIFSFIQEIESCDFKEAAQILADRAGVKIQEENLKNMLALPGLKDKKENLIKIHEEINKVYVDNLWESTDGKKVLEYVRARGIEDEFIRKFSIGFSLDSYDSVYNYLLNNNFQKKDLIDSGLVSSKDIEGSQIFDKFRLRLMFPIFDQQGRVVAFGGRALKKDQEPKYLNSPETEIYNKSKILYGLHLAKTEIKQKNEVLVVEGYMDMIASYQASVKNVVSVSGTALTNEHLKILKRLCENIIFCFDNDSAGKNACIRAISMAQSLNFNIFIVSVPEGKDPGEFAVKNKEAFAKLIEDKKPYIDFYLENIEKDFNLNDINDSKKAQNFILELISGINDGWEREKILEKVSLKLKIDKKYLLEKLTNLINAKKNFPIQSRNNSLDRAELSQRLANDRAFEYILAFDDILTEKSSLFFDLIKKLPELDLSAPLKNIYNKILQYYNSGADISEFGKFIFLDREELEFINILGLKIADKNDSKEQREKIFTQSIAKLTARAHTKEKLDVKSKSNLSSDNDLSDYNEILKLKKH